MGVKQMKRRIFSGVMCEQLVYNVPSGTRNPSDYNPEKPPRKRFRDEEERARHREEISRRNFIRMVNENFDPGDIYSTVTFDNDWEVHTFSEARRIRSNFVRVLQRGFPDAVICAVMGRGKSTERIHFHLITKGIPEEFIANKWKYGKVRRFVVLRAHNWYEGIDCGADFTGLANYLFEHWTPEQGGHRWFMTKNARKPNKEKPTEVRVAGGYSKKRPPVPPKGYKLVEIKSTQYGYLYFKYVVEPPKDTKRLAAKKTGHGTG